MDNRKSFFLSTTSGQYSSPETTLQVSLSAFETTHARSKEESGRTHLKYPRICYSGRTPTTAKTKITDARLGLPLDFLKIIKQAEEIRKVTSHQKNTNHLLPNLDQPYT